MKPDGILIALLVIVACVSVPWNVAAGAEPGLTLAVAANFRMAAEDIASSFERRENIRVDRIYASTGKLYAQIAHGAPVDLFLAADGERPDLLFQKGLCGEPFEYAEGEAVLWARSAAGRDKAWQAVLRQADIKRVALPKPVIAPYGAVVKEVLLKKGMWKALEPRLVYGQNVAQAFQFCQVGGADLAFTSLSYALSEKGRQGAFWRIPEARAVTQKGCVVTSAVHRRAAERFRDLLLSAETRRVISSYGYLE